MLQLNMLPGLTMRFIELYLLVVSELLPVLIFLDEEYEFGDL